MDNLALLPFFISAIGGLLLLLLVRNPARRAVTPLVRSEAQAVRELAAVGAASGARDGVKTGVPTAHEKAGVGAGELAMPSTAEAQVSHPALAIMAVVTLALALATTVVVWAIKAPVFHIGFFGDRVDFSNFSAFFTALVLGCGIVTVLALQPYAREEAMDHGELYALILFAVSGMIVLASATDLVVMFLGLEIMSLAIYALVGLRRHDRLGNEAALKYVLLGAFSSALFLFGVAFCYGGAASTNLHEISAALSAAHAGDRGLFLVGLMLLLSGLAFKVGAFPFHMWVPDVYQGAAAPVTGFMATAVKAASFAFFLRIVLVGFGALHGVLLPLVWWLAVLTMFTGNILAFMQTNLKRMLAYSSIAHTGYLLVGFAAALTASGSHAAGAAATLSASTSHVASAAASGTPGALAAVQGAINTTAQSLGGSAMLFYLVAYALTNLGAFACIAYLSGRDERLVDVASWSGMGRKHPWMALLMGICMLSLIGFPPTAGFFGKYLLFSAAIRAGLTPLAVIGIVNSILSLWYYLRVVVVMTMGEPTPEADAPSARWGSGAAALYAGAAVVWAGVGTITLIGLFPGAQSLLNWAQLSMGSLF